MTTPAVDPEGREPMLPMQYHALDLRVADQYRVYGATAREQMLIDLERLLKAVAQLTADLVAARAEKEKAQAALVEAHDLIARPGRDAAHNHKACLIDGILGLQEELAEARAEQAQQAEQFARAEARLREMREKVEQARVRLVRHASSLVDGSYSQNDITKRECFECADLLDPSRASQETK